MSDIQIGWREAARGIPVWPGCREMDGGIVVGFTDDGNIIRKVDGGLLGACHPATSGPDLSDPDTRAAYDRRLSLELGAPGEAVADGVVVHVSDMGFDDALFGHILVIRAGRGDTGVRATWETTVQVDTKEPLLARALAWPAGKRVRG